MEAKTAMTAATVTAIGTLLGAIISGIVSLVVSSIQHNKTVAILEVKIDDLTKRVDKHNNTIERVYELERVADVHEEKIKVANHRIDDLEDAKQNK